MDPEQFKTWSQNLGHEDVLTTFANYGTVSVDRQSEIMEILRSMLQPSQPTETQEQMLREFLDWQRRRSSERPSMSHVHDR